MNSGGGKMTRSEGYKVKRRRERKVASLDLKAEQNRTKMTLSRETLNRLEDGMTKIHVLSFKLYFKFHHWYSFCSLLSQLTTLSNLASSPNND
ncbi:unnamed protein product [Sphenostylis stenocarpa]|uniref:Uncharacterized protein n=1 Tax=Sphenostylis stenocarpa TaxID=92480 RepID=A0AA86RUB2_9FABA|nr:unnamed protein product [Sphenostylis stenocarpa]